MVLDEVAVEAIDLPRGQLWQRGAVELLAPIFPGSHAQGTLMITLTSLVFAASALAMVAVEDWARRTGRAPRDLRWLWWTFAAAFLVCAALAAWRGSER